MAGPQRGARPQPLAFAALALAALCTVVGLAPLACDDDESPATPTGLPAATDKTADTASSSLAAGGAPAVPDAGTEAGASATPDASAQTDGPPKPSGTAPPPDKTTPRPSTQPPATAAPTASPTAQPTAPPSATTSGVAALPGVDPETLPPPEPGSADEMAARVDEIYQPIRRFRARFDQTYRAKVAGVTKKSQGLLFVEKPAKLSMRYDPPNNNRVVSDGSIVKVYEADNKQMFTQPVARTEYPGALAFIMGRGLRASFAFAFHDKAKFPGGKVLMGKPRVKNPAYERAFFYIDSKLLDQRDPRAMRRVLVLDVQKNRNRFDFTEIAKPDKIDPQEFTFTPPPGTTLVK